MSTIEIDPADLTAAISALPPDQPVLMVNLLKFKPSVDYSQAPISGSGQLPNVSGQKAYLTRYLPAFNEAMAPHGTSELVFAGFVAARLVGPAAAAWDAIAVVAYPNIQVFRDLVDDPVYRQTAAPHRLASLADWQLFATQSITG